MSDYAAARLNMVESQLRPNAVTDTRILRAMNEVPRELFVPEKMRPLAYMDEHIKVRSATATIPARHLMAPMPLARLIQLADIDGSDVVLDVGCATGYSTAILARLAGAVVGLEPVPAVAEEAARVLAELEVDNADIVVGPLPEGHAEQGPYDAIVLGGSVPEAPVSLFGQLKDGGRLVAVETASGGFGRAFLYTSIAGDVSRRAAFDAGVPGLPGFERREEFVF